MNKEDFWYLIVILLFVVDIGFVWYCNSLEEPITHYEYVDLSDNKGVSESCFRYRGGLFCKLGEDATIQVKEFIAIRGE